MHVALALLKERPTRGDDMQIKTCAWCGHDRPDVEKSVDPVRADNAGEYVEVEICRPCYRDRCLQL